MDRKRSQKKWTTTKRQHKVREQNVCYPERIPSYHKGEEKKTQSVTCVRRVPTRERGAKLSTVVQNQRRTQQWFEGGGRLERCKAIRNTANYRRKTWQKKRRRRTRYVRESTSYGIQSEKKPERYCSLNDSKEENKKNERPKDSTPRTHEGEVKAVLRGQPR